MGKAPGLLAGLYAAPMAQLLYVVDPMCSWCWGFRGVIEQVRAVHTGLQWELVMGGLARDSDEPMDEATRSHVQQAWHDVADRTGAAFNHEFWTKCQPRRSTYPACRAVIIAREKGRAEEMLAAIQRAYYQEARNPSDIETLIALAGDIGLDREDFGAAMDDPATQVLLEGDFSLRRTLGANSFPSIGVREGDQLRLLTSGWCDAESLATAIEAGC